MTQGPFALPLWLALAAFSTAGQAQPASPQPAPASYVTVKVEIHGLQESARVLRDAAQSLASTLEDLRTRRKDLTPEQLDRLAAVAREMNEVVRAVERTIQESSAALEQARGPAKAMIADVVSSARGAGVDPVLRSIHGYVTTWLAIAIAGGLAALFLTLFAFFTISRQLRDMVATLKSLADEYELVRRSPSGKER